MSQPQLSPYKGARDFYPADKRRLDCLMTTLAGVAESYGYQSVEAPLIEPVELYRLKTQANPEIVDNQLYSFVDKADRQLAIRPEMTPSLARMVAARQGELSLPLRWYSWPRLWRYEQPQRGRLREHWQFNVDLFGQAGLAAEFELICLAAAIFRQFGAGPETYRLEISSRALMQDLLVDHLGLEPAQIGPAFGLVDRWSKDPESCRRQFQALLSSSQSAAGVVDKLEALLAVDSPEKLPAEILTSPNVGAVVQLLADLSQAGLTNISFNPAIVRGFDYYTGIVFEAFDCHSDNRRSLLGGGRYDRLVESVGGQPCPTVGFGLGEVTLANFLDSHSLQPPAPSLIQAAVALVEIDYPAAQPTLEAWRRAGLRLVVESGDRRLGKKIAWAGKQEVPYLIVFGPDELASGRFRLRALATGRETEVSAETLADQLRQFLAGG